MQFYNIHILMAIVTLEAAHVTSFYCKPERPMGTCGHDFKYSPGQKTMVTPYTWGSGGVGDNYCPGMAIRDAFSSYDSCCTSDTMPADVGPKGHDVSVAFYNAHCTPMSGTGN
ncbi:hypothetical protein MJO28_007738 [Puccinia striiformis f. sp. tritici]|uniref:Secreted protein n=4 Tax=Puccinia striiformis TaxID=27350 RepID=A0A0L0VX13_9BASI|nr:hypothetical protein Pst134EA_013837 [Puccinia striiformis f. sp. tritici]KAI9612894.1 hypothetical protein KEM48_003969 [Puccinia striiformis f. sp. tritici PST-130]KNF03540.1 hypothetical protein PSTG_03068 [Puccinia striiformis f. sp. tritici PST-78]POW09793.1 hypothetical protein PSTT_06603 [Puccinia striiformis]KAH9454728.1 hypothetical protein Pst134EB_014792 [Puccinia striiformis f. sp. tritici]KAH9465983.1 hypothetical protein Pst134EA_013837 [Puccinia striiformis f. sp. tritici]